MKKILTVLLSALTCVPAVASDFPAVTVFEKASSSVVLIIGRGEGQRQGMVGAGSFVLPKGVVLTNAHVVIDKDDNRPFRNLQVFTRPEKLSGDLRKDLKTGHGAKVKAFDSDLDLAIVEVRELGATVVPIELANPDEIRIGEEVAAIGHPEQGGLWSLTSGRISGLMANQSDIPGKDVYQTDTSVNRGNSGGPLLDRRGYLVGVNSNIARVGAGNLPITGVNFAVKSDVARKWLERQGIVLAYGSAPLVEPVGMKVQAAPATTSVTSAPTETPKSTPPVAVVPPPTVTAPPASPSLPPLTVQPPPPKAQAATPKAQETTPAPVSPQTQTKKPVEDKVLTPKRPYKFVDLMAATEAEMEDMMGEMRGKIGK